MLNRGFAETMALKRSAGLETVACWQTDSQWVDPRDTRSARCAVRAPRLLRDVLGRRRPRGGEVDDGGVLRHHHDPRSSASRRSANRMRACICPSTTRSPAGSPRRVARLRSWPRRFHCASTASACVCTPRARHERGGRYLDDLRQPHWEGTRRERDSQEAFSSEQGERSSRNASGDTPRSARSDTPPRREGNDPGNAKVSRDRAAASDRSSTDSARSDSAQHAVEALLDGYRELVELRRRAQRSLGRARASTRKRSTPIRWTWRSLCSWPACVTC